MEDEANERLSGKTAHRECLSMSAPQTTEKKEELIDVQSSWEYAQT
jgi:hypothetical protein